MPTATNIEAEKASDIAAPIVMEHMADAMWEIATKTRRECRIPLPNIAWRGPLTGTPDQWELEVQADNKRQIAYLVIRQT